MNFWKIVNNVIKESDILLVVLDARLPELTRNSELENKIKKENKKILFVINKCDLLSKEVVEKIKRKIKPSVFVSAKKHYGTNILREKVMQIARGEKVTVGVLGYPNVGKSSVINMLKGRTAAPVAPISGYTKGIQKIKASQKLLLLDTPGVIPYEEKNDLKQTLIGTINFDKTKDPEQIVLNLIEHLSDQISKAYNVESNEDAEEILEQIAIKRNKVKKGNIPDTLTMSKIILKDWQQGKIRIS